MRIPADVLDEVIHCAGAREHGPVSETGILRLALDLREARAALAQAHEDQEQLFSAMAFIRRSNHAGSAIMHPAKILDWAREIVWKP